VKKLLRLGNVGKKDVFYDLGCGDGLTVCMAITDSHAKKAIGVEVDRGNFEEACSYAIDELSKAQLKKVRFWLGYIHNVDTDDDKLIFDYSDGTVVYWSLEEDRRDVAFYKERLNHKVRIIRKDLPLVGYKPDGASREDSDCWFFLNKFPLKKMKNRDEWAKEVLGSDKVTIKDVFKYYRKQLRSRNTEEEGLRNSLRRLRRLVSSRFSIG
jgi:hypothetical protein